MNRSLRGTAWTLSLLLLLLFAPCAMAEAPFPGASFDIRAHWVGDGASANYLLPREAGGVLLLGSAVYPGEPMLEPLKVGYEELPDRRDAYLVALDAAGEIDWSLRLNDPHAENYFDSAWPTGDGRYYVRFSDHDGPFGSQVLIVNEAGQVDGMLPGDALRAVGGAMLLERTEDGFLTGAFSTDAFESVHWMLPGDAIRRLDADLNVLWTLESDSLLGVRHFRTLRETDEAYFFSGEVTEVAGVTSVPSAMKIRKEDGALQWRYMGHKYAASYAESCLPTADGGLLFVARNDPEQPTLRDAEDAASLTKLSAEGEVEWTRLYADTYGFTSFTAMEPFGEGALLLGTLSDYRSRGLLYVTLAGEPLGYLHLPHREGDPRANTPLLAGAKDGAYLYGTTLYYREDWPGEGPIEQAYYAHLTPAMFADGGDAPAP